MALGMVRREGLILGLDLGPGSWEVPNCRVFLVACCPFGI